MMTLICGLPNAGKTTYSQRFKNVIHTDQVKPTKKSFLKTVLEIVKTETEDICIEGLYTTKQSRKHLIEAYSGEDKICIWLNIPVETCISRQNRNRKSILIKNCASIFEPPTYEQGWDKIIIITENGKKEILNKEEEK